MKIDRLMGILTLLLQNEKVTAPYLAERFEVSRRTINRDIESLCLAGIPIVTLQGAGGGIALMQGYTIDKMMLTNEELQAILTGLQSLESVTEISSYQQIMDKFGLDQASIYNSENHIMIDLSSHYKDTLSPKIKMIQEAIAKRRCLVFDYYYSKGEVKKAIEPYLIVFKWNDWYVIGYCLDQADFRMFKLNRLWNLEMIEITYEPKALPEDQKAFDCYFTNEIKLEALFDSSVKYRLVEEYGIESFEVTKDNGLMFKWGFTSEVYLMSWLLSFGQAVEVIRPIEIRNKVHEELIKAAEKYKET